MKFSSLIRPNVQTLHAYVPGEQPAEKGLVKLDTNENPYPPSPAVIKALKASIDGRLRLYPNPTAKPLREGLAKLHGCDPDNILIGNGSDELLALATRAFVEPVPAGTKPSSLKNAAASRSRIQYFHPSYSLYPVLTEIHNAIRNPVALPHDFDLPSPASLKRGGRWDFKAALTFVTTPNAPSGRGYETERLKQLCQAQKGVVILDEAYVDFANENALNLALEIPHVLVSRTFSKSYSLCFQRVGYFVGHRELIAALNRIRDSYNVNGLGQIAATTTLKHLSYYRRNFREIIATREWLCEELSGLGFETLPSQTNFLLSKPPRFSAETWLNKLRERKFLVRWFKLPEVNSYLRITIGTPAEMRSFLRAVKLILRQDD